MNKTSRLLLSIVLGSLTVGCSPDESMNKTNAERSAAIQAEKMRHKAMAADIAGHESIQAQQYMAMPAKAATSHQAKFPEIGRRADNLPAALSRTQPQLVRVDLYTEELVAEMMPDVTYEYWTFNSKVPGPFIRVREGDQVEIHLSQGKHGIAAGGHREHISSGHFAHSIDLHAVVGPGGGMPLTQGGPGEEKSFRFKATHPGIYVYHCGSPHVPTHVANGMYGLILVEPEQGLAKVDREFYVMQGDFYTSGQYGDEGLQAFSKEKMLAEKPEYFLFNGRVDSLSGERALKAKVGEKIRLFVGVGSHIASNFHIIGAIFDSLYPAGAIMNPPLKNIQTAAIAPGSAVMIEFTAKVPGEYLLVDHSLARAIDKGAVAELIIEGSAQPELYQ
jgi:nitrite reductase (NO-forming)